MNKFRMAKLHTFTADERLKSRKRIDELFEKGQRFNTGPFRIFYLMQAGTKPSLKCGAGASSKNFKRAVDRNRIKRLIRECWRDFWSTEASEQVCRSRRN